MSEHYVSYFGTNLGEAKNSTIPDSINMLGHEEILSKMLSGISVIDMRGSQRNRAIQQYTINCLGMHIGVLNRNFPGPLNCLLTLILPRTEDQEPASQENASK
jgi:hypothetical protein